MKKYGGFIPGIRAGRPTAEYLDYVVSRLTLPGSVYLALIAIIPLFAFNGLGVSGRFIFGGTSLLIMVGVGLDTVKQIESQCSNATTKGSSADANRAHGPPRGGEGDAGGRGRREVGDPPHLDRRDLPCAHGPGHAVGDRCGHVHGPGQLRPRQDHECHGPQPPGQPDAADGFLLDGYPRTLDQVAVLDEMLADVGLAVTTWWS